MQLCTSLSYILILTNNQISMKFHHSNFQKQKYKHIKIPCLRTTVIISVIFQKEKIGKIQNSQGLRVSPENQSSN